MEQLIKYVSVGSNVFFLTWKCHGLSLIQCSVMVSQLFSKLSAVRFRQHGSQPALWHCWTITAVKLLRSYWKILLSMLWMVLMTLIHFSPLLLSLLNHQWIYCQILRFALSLRDNTVESEISSYPFFCLFLAACSFPDLRLVFFTLWSYMFVWQVVFNIFPVCRGRLSCLWL